MELAEGIKPPPNLVLGGSQSQPMLEAGVREVARTNRPARRGYLLIETSEGKEIVESLDSVDRVTDTGIHLAVARQVDKTDEGSFEGV